MEQENISSEEPQIVKTSKLNTVTPLSKYLALALFVALPFMGGWIGYTYAPEKIVEVEKIIYEDSKLSKAESQTPVYQATDKPSAEVAFVSYNEGGWKSGWMARKNPKTQEWENVKQVAGKYIDKTGVLIKKHVFLSTHGDIQDNSDWSSFATIVSLENNEVTHLPIDGYLVNLLEVEDSVFALIIDNGMCLDSPGRIVDTNSDTCKGKIIKITPDGTLTTAFPELPGAKQLIAYNPITQTIVLSDGYGDAGCVSSNFYTYSLTNKTVVDSESYGGCDDEIYGDEMPLYDSYTTDIENFKQTIKSTYPYHIYNEEMFAQSFSFIDSQVVVVSKEIRHPEAYWVTEIPLN